MEIANQLILDILSNWKPHSFPSIHVVKPPSDKCFFFSLFLIFYI